MQITNSKSIIDIETLADLKGFIDELDGIIGYPENVNIEVGINEIIATRED